MYVCISYNLGVSFSRIWKPFLCSVIIRKDKASVSQSLWENRILTSVTASKLTQLACSKDTTQPFVILHVPAST